MCECKGSSTLSSSVIQSLDELDFERGLWSAAQYGDKNKVIKLLNEKQFPVDKRDAAGYTSLHYAARNGHLNICKILLENGANIEAVTPEGKVTPLLRAASTGKYDVIKYLLENKANYLAKDVDGKTALHRAVEGQHIDVCEFLIKFYPSLKNQFDNKNKKPIDYVKNNENLSSLFIE